MIEQKNILSGLRVIDCGTYIAGPAAATILSDFGAEVIKIERPPFGDPYRTLSFAPNMPASDVNYCWLLDARNKQSLALNLNEEAGREALRRLVKTADIFITNYTPDLIEKFDLGYELLSEINERLIYAHLTGYGEEGEDVNKPGYDTTAYWARSGLTGMIHDLTVQTGSMPCGTGDHPVSLALFGSIMLALYQRQMTGHGAKVSTSLMATGAWSNSCQVQAALVGAEFPARRTRFTALNPLINQYQTRDRQRFIFCCLDTERDWGRICRALGIPELSDDPRYASVEGRSENNNEVISILDVALITKDLSEWEPLFRAENIVWGLIPTMHQVAADPQMKANGVFAEFEHPQLGKVNTVSSPINVHGVTKEIPKAAPSMGEHSHEILRQLNFDEADIEDMIQNGVTN